MTRIEEAVADPKLWPAYALDVLAHAGLGAAYALPPMAAGILWLSWPLPASLGAGFAAALLGGFLREVVQAVKTSKLHPFDRSLDVLHHGLGVLVAWGILEFASGFIGG